MAEIPYSYLYASVDVETYVGTGAYGDRYADPVSRRCAIDDTRRLVRSSDGQEVVSETTLITRREYKAQFTPGSKVALPDRVAKVIKASELTDGGRGAWQHLEVALT
ncbi:hypothetical protein [uncultured Aeromicrobium sp.]|uniref:hypothetical protein n=1 Tax=uncultured Aeromicrobium sp. TaxID=337820 RepID=UPI0025F14868|nr:hypothetical protein [uncultured Aeromicrobium sp.]